MDHWCNAVKCDSSDERRCRDCEHYDGSCGAQMVVMLTRKEVQGLMKFKDVWGSEDVPDVKIVNLMYDNGLDELLKRMANDVELDCILEASLDDGFDNDDFEVYE